MRILLIYDQDNENENSRQIKDYLETYYNIIKVINVNKENITFCSGCIGCWVKTPGICIKNDILNTINREFINSDAVIYISAIIFGQYSAIIKNVMDRYIPNVLPFFVKNDGITIHPNRYEKYPYQILVGYGNNLSEEEKDIFLTLTKGIYNKSFDEVLIHENNSSTIRRIQLALEKVYEKNMYN